MQPRTLEPQGKPMPSAPEETGRLPRAGDVSIAYRRRPGKRPTVVFLGGFKSDMAGSKASALDAFCAARGQAFLRFDYQGHGESGGRFEDGTVGAWTADALAALDTLTEGELVLVGSSMGGWIMLNVALARPDRVKALIGIAAAPDFTEDLIWQQMEEPARMVLETEGVIYETSSYGDDPYAITKALIDDGRKHLKLREAIPFAGPVRLLHGQRDPDVPWERSLMLAEKLASDDVRVLLVKDGDHRLAREADLALLTTTLAELL
jgi:pimeloyl-ACP methyl ester carboxylesterase